MARKEAQYLKQPGVCFLRAAGVWGLAGRRHTVPTASTHATRANRVAVIAVVPAAALLPALPGKMAIHARTVELRKVLKLVAAVPRVVLAAVPLAPVVLIVSVVLTFSAPGQVLVLHAKMVELRKASLPTAGAASRTPSVPAVALQVSSTILVGIANVLPSQIQPVLIHAIVIRGPTQPIGLLWKNVLLVILKMPVLPPTLTLAMRVVTGELRTPVQLVHTQPALHATALAPVTRKPVLHAVTEGPLTRVPVVNLSQELFALVGVLPLQLQLTENEMLENVATVTVRVKLPRKHCAKRVQQPFGGL